jgi:hypothetical protein
VWDGGEGREGGRSEMRGVGISRAGARSGVGAVGGRGKTGPRAHFCGGICVPNSSSCDIDVTELCDVSHASLRRRVARWGEPLSRLSWRGRVRSSSTRSFPRHDTRRRALRGSTTVVAAPITSPPRGWHRPWLASSLTVPRARSPSHACTSASTVESQHHPSQGHITSVTPAIRSSRWPPTDPSRPPPRKPRKTPGIRTAIHSTRLRAAPPPSATASPSPTSWSRR